MNTQYLGHKFIERQSEITDDILEDAYILDELIIKLSYEEMKEASLGGLAKPKEKAEASESPEQTKADNIPDDASRIAARLEAANKTKQHRAGPPDGTRKPPLRSSAQKRGPGSASQQRRPAGNKRSTGERPAQTQQKRPVPTQQQKRPTPTQQRRKPPTR